MPPETKISFIRHGNVYNPGNIIYGRLPRYSLSKQGLEDARRAGAALSRVEISAIYCSPLLRTRQTAREILKFHPGLTLHVSKMITEVATPFEGHSESMLEQVSGDVYAHPSDDGEQPLEILERSRKFIERVRKKHFGTHIAAVSHGDVVFFLLLFAHGYAATAENKTGLSKLSRIQGYPATGSITTFIYRGRDRDEVPLCQYRVP